MFKNTRKAIAVAIFSALIIGLLPLSAAAAESPAVNNVWLEARSGTGSSASIIDLDDLEVGDEFAVWVMVSGATRLQGAEIQLEFTSNTLQAQKPLVEDVIEDVIGKKEIDQEAGIILFAASNSTSSNYVSAIILKATFEVIANGSSYVRFRDGWPKFSDDDADWIVPSQIGDELSFNIGPIETVKYTLELQGDHIISSPAAGQIDAGTSVTVTVNPPAGKRVATFTVGGVDRKSNLVNNQYSFNIAANTTVAVTYEDIPVTKYTLTLNGSGISSVPVAGQIATGTNVTVTVNPPSGKRVATFTVDGVDRKADLVNNEYSFDITADTTVAVTYEDIQPAVDKVWLEARKSTAASAGTISPSKLKIGDSFAVWVEVSGAYQLQGAEVQLEFSSDILEIQEPLVEGVIKDVVGAKEADQDAGTLIYAAANTKAADYASAFILKIPFKVVANGSARIAFQQGYPEFSWGELENAEWIVPGYIGDALKFTVTAKSTSGSSGSGSSSSTKDDEVIVEVPEEEIPESAPYAGYEDVADEAWYYDAVKFVSEYGLFKGISADLFGPDIPINRAMFVTILSRLEFGSDEEVPIYENPFEDMKQEWYQKAVAWAYENGITLGINETEFDPDGILSREQMAVFLYRYAEYKGYEVDYDDDVLAAFADQDQISPWAAEGMAWAVEKGLLQGTAADALSPQEQASRAQAATIFMRFVGLLEADE